MKITLSTLPLARIRADLLVAVFDKETQMFSADGTPLGRALKRARDGFRKGEWRRELFQTFDKSSPTKSLLVFASSLSKAYDLRENVKIFAARALGYASDYGLHDVAFLLNHAEAAAYAECAVEGFVLGDYRFDKYRKKSPGTKAKPVAIQLVCRAADRKAVDAQAKRSRLVAEEVNRARDLVNEPGDRMVPKTLAATAKKIATAGGLNCTILRESELSKQGYSGLIAVGKGSIYPPRLIVLRYRPRKKSKQHLALVGKGITFDTGGISIKPSEGMWQMKGDMAGGAAVLGAMAAISVLKPKVAVTGIVAAAENFPGPEAQRPGDIFIAKNGKSVMVDNTDAEGRLVLTDALARAGEEKATHIVDAATLTGSCVRALGTSVAGAMGNDSALVRAVIDSGSRCGEVFWELPLVEEYRELLRTPSADLNNIGGRNAGAITAGLFLEEFVPEGASWVHLDIAGPFILEKKWKYYPEGATGFGVKTMVDLAERFHELF